MYFSFHLKCQEILTKKIYLQDLRETYEMKIEVLTKQVETLKQK